MFRFLIAALLLASAAPAQSPLDPDPFPAIFNVSGVASDDVLNIRERPTGKAPIISTLAHDATYVEIIAVNETGRWGWVGTGETGMGWVSMAYLAPIEGGRFPTWPHMQCAGSEAPWVLRFQQGGAGSFQDGYVDPAPVTASTIRSGSESYRAFGMSAVGDGLTVTAAIRQLACESTMIDDTSGLQGVVITRTSDGQTSVKTGCCSLIAP